MSVAEKHEMLRKTVSAPCKDEVRDVHITKALRKKRRKKSKLLRICLGISLLLNLTLLITVTYTLIDIGLTDKEIDELTHICDGESNKNSKTKHSQHNLVGHRIFSDLTAKEQEDVQHYIYTKTNLGVVPLARAGMESTFIHSVELLDPPKESVVNKLKFGDFGRQREAKVIIMNTGLKQPSVEEYVIGPLGNYREMSMRKFTESPTSSVPYRVRQFTFPEVLEMYITIKRYTEIHDILLESYGATLFDCIKNNMERCLVAYKSHVPIVYSSERKIWVSFFYYMEYYTLHPIDFEILMNIQSSKSDDWTIECIWYAGRFYPNYEDFLKSYKNNTIPKMKSTFPVDDINDNQIPGSLHRRSKPDGHAANSDSKRGPVQFEPDGRRFALKGQSVRYMGWVFDWKNSLVGGPQLHNVRFNDDTIAYEIGIQDIVVMYSGNSPAFSHAAFADGLNGLGSKTAGLVPGVDCPDYALMLNISVVTEDFLTDSTLSNALCIFEHNNGVPLRRHYANSHGQAGVFYGGLESKALIFRTIFVVNNYDYIMDYMFYENGVFETKVYPTGYILTTYSFTDGSDFGFNMDKNTIAPYHLHLFHFKVDIDILGRENRYKTVDVKVENFTSNVSIYSNGTQYRYKLKQSLKKTEKESTVRTNESTAKYHLFYNEKYKNKHGDYRAYQLETKDCVEQLLPENYGFESSIKWSRYKLAVTQRKTGEERSSSMYASFDAGKPTVDFQKFIDDNDNIVDEDLVAWVTLGMHHIPHTEDIPNVATAGKSLSFSLMPFNFFDEDPSIASRNSVRITPKDPTNSRKGLNIERYGTKEKYSCIPQSYDYDNLRRDGTSIFYPVN